MNTFKTYAVGAEEKYLLIVEERLRGEGFRSYNFHESAAEAMKHLRDAFSDATNFISTTDHEADEIHGTFVAWRTLHFVIKKAYTLK